MGGSTVALIYLLPGLGELDGEGGGQIEVMKLGTVVGVKVDQHGTVLQDNRYNRVLDLGNQSINIVGNRNLKSSVSRVLHNFFN